MSTIQEMLGPHFDPKETSFPLFSNDKHNPFREECPTIVADLNKKLLTYSHDDNFIITVFKYMALRHIYDEKGREGLREAEKQYKEKLNEKQNSQTKT